LSTCKQLACLLTSCDISKNHEHLAHI